jgi:hypothetical protein
MNLTKKWLASLLNRTKSSRNAALLNIIIAIDLTMKTKTTIFKLPYRKVALSKKRTT